MGTTKNGDFGNPKAHVKTSCTRRGDVVFAKKDWPFVDKHKAEKQPVSVESTQCTWVAIVIKPQHVLLLPRALLTRQAQPTESLDTGSKGKSSAPNTKWNSCICWSSAVATLMLVT